ncbi:nurim homolog [Gigantopelta aegis]|uniref:nurim homolog n=1 Tax=Gigantopelta aegis TaxID=1735272 RepID=UPI001B88BAD4|nr:nurim homolog [Gigantopelta aegis]
MLVLFSHLLTAPVCCLLLWTSLGMLVPFLSSQHIRKRPEEDVFELSLVVFDIFLVLLFILQHTMMATSWFKSALAYCNIVVIERLLYVAATSVALLTMMVLWIPIESYPLWFIDTSDSIALWLFFTLLHVLAWFILFLQVLVMNPLELIGIKQIYYYHKGLESPLVYLSNRLKRLYLHMRHPGATCLFVILWFHPHMTLDRFILAFFLNIFLHCGFSVTELDYKFARTEFIVKKVSYQFEKVE